MFNTFYKMHVYNKCSMLLQISIQIYLLAFSFYKLRLILITDCLSEE